MATEPDPAPVPSTKATVAWCSDYLASRMRMGLIQAKTQEEWDQLMPQIVDAWKLNPEPACRGLTAAENDQVRRVVLKAVGPDILARVADWAG